MKRILIALCLVLVLATGAFATDFETLTVTSSPAVVMTSTKYYHVGQYQDKAFSAMCTCTSGTLRFTTNGTTPTSSVGHQLLPGESVFISGYNDIANFKAIAESTTGYLNCSYYFDQNSPAIK